MLKLTADELLFNTLRYDAPAWGRSPSRNGPVLRAPGLFITEYPSSFVPVMLSPIRDANPFFHLFEAFYFLAGRNDVDSCAYFASNMASYSDDGKTLFSSYGDRWINHFKQDQLKALIQHLQADPSSRRAVLQMWDPNTDLPVLLSGDGLDLSCNYSAVFDPQPDGSLDMRVDNRSNDLIFGAYGANMVHFNILHQYVAYALGRPKGVYRQVSNNTHVYTEFPITKRFLENVVTPTTVDGYPTPSHRVTAAYLNEIRSTFSNAEAVAYHTQFDHTWDEWESHGVVSSELDLLISTLMGERDESDLTVYEDLPAFLSQVFVPMFYAFRNWKNTKDATASIQILNNYQESTLNLSPWIRAGREWLERRAPKS